MVTLLLGVACFLYGAAQDFRSSSVGLKLRDATVIAAALMHLQCEHG